MKEKIYVMYLKDESEKESEKVVFGEGAFRELGSGRIEEALKFVFEKDYGKQNEDKDKI